MKLTEKEIKEKYPSAFIEQGAIIGQGAFIRENAVIGRGAVIGQGAFIRENAFIGQNTVIGQGAVIRAGAAIGQGAFIGQGAIIGQGAVIRAGAAIGVQRKEADQSLVILGVGETKKLTAYRCSDGLIINICCQNEYKGYPYKEMKAEISKKYDKDHAYFIALKLIKNWHKNL